MSCSLALVVVYAVSTAAAPINDTSVVILNSQAAAYNVFTWLSIGLALFTALLQGLVTALAFMAEDSRYWTVRFRLARREHIWWTFVASLLVVSLVLVAISFLSGNSGESVGILAIASATALAIVQYMIPAWKSRHFIANRWLAWTGNSRTGIDASNGLVCGDRAKWSGVLEGLEVTQLFNYPWDWYGWDLFRATSIPHDPTDIIRCAKIKDEKRVHMDYVRPVGKKIYIYDDGLVDNGGIPKRVSLLWGSPIFLPRVSRAITSIPRSLLASRPISPDGYAGEGVCLALGVLGRNKGLNPSTLVFKKKIAGTIFLEDTSNWAPRPSKVLRNVYDKLMEVQFHDLGPMYVDAAVELSLLFMDCPAAAITRWFNDRFEHQDIDLNWQLRNNPAIRMHELNAHYRSSYTSMIISLNYMRWSPSPPKMAKRPDLICTGLLLRAEGKPQPSWWTEQPMKDRRGLEMEALTDGALEAAAKLLGLKGYPKSFEGAWSEDSEKSEDTWYGQNF